MANGNEFIGMILKNYNDQYIIISGEIYVGSNVRHVVGKIDPVTGKIINIISITSRTLRDSWYNANDKSYNVFDSKDPSYGYIDWGYNTKGNGIVLFVT